MAKDRWNREVSVLVRRVGDADLGAMRRGVEDVGRAVWRSVRKLGEEAKEEVKERGK